MVLKTILYSKEYLFINEYFNRDEAVEVTDFCPRFKHGTQTQAPPSIIRKVS